MSSLNDGLVLGCKSKVAKLLLAAHDVDPEDREDCSTVILYENLPVSLVEGLRFVAFPGKGRLWIYEADDETSSVKKVVWVSIGDRRALLVLKRMIEIALDEV